MYTYNWFARNVSA